MGRRLGGGLGVAILLALSLCASEARSQQQICVKNTSGGCVPVSAANPFPVTGSFSATIAGFPTVQANGTPIAVTTTAGGVTGTMPTGTTVVATNVGTTNPAYCTLGASSTTSGQYIAPAGGQFPFTVGANTQLTCISTGGTTTVNMVGGSGISTGTGGGGGSSGGGLSVTDQAAWTQGSSAFTPGGGVFNDAATLSSGQQGDYRLTTKRAQIVDVDSSGNQLHSDLTSPIPTCGANPCTNRIGMVDFAVNVTLTDCSGTVASGGVANNAFTAQTTLHGFTIVNDDTSEVMWISFTTTAAASTAGSYPLAPATATSFAGASSFTSPPGMGTNHALSVVAATSAHKFSCTWW